MRIVVAAVGRLKEPYFQAAEAEYKKRLRPYCRLDVVEPKTSAALLSALPTGCHLYALDERGDLITSEELATQVLGKEALRGGGAPVAFAIGGPEGHVENTRLKARRLLAFGRITIAHRLVRLVLLEQLYRAFRILRGEPYHR